jgi:hypothetical protein
LSGSRYFVVFTDDFSRKSWVAFLKSKAETFEKFKSFKAQVEAETGKKILTLRTDRGGEFTSGLFNNFCSQNGIRRELRKEETEP